MFLCGLTAEAQQTPEDFKVYTEHPRLLLNSRRLRLLKRERERQSPRWTQFETLIKGKAQMPEAAFANALYFQITGDAAAARTAIEAAARPATDTRQVALVYDWCDSQLTDAQRAQLKDRLERSLKTPINNVASGRDRTFAGLALGDGPALYQAVIQWWRNTEAASLMAGNSGLENADIYPFTEFAHVVRDNLQIDVRDDIPPIFRDVSLDRILSYYPAPYPAPENEYHIPYYTGKGEPDLKLAALTRAGELALVAFESNAQEMQFLQGWLLRDRFILRGSFGVPYEFLWANPYQPGLPFEKLPLSYHDARTGMLLMRSSWEDDAIWLCVRADVMQIFRDGQIRPGSLKDPLEIGGAMVLPGSASNRDFRLAPTAPEQWYLLGLKHNTTYDVEIDYEEMTDISTDRAGIAYMSFPRRNGQAVYVHEPRETGGTLNLLAR